MMIHSPTRIHVPFLCLPVLSYLSLFPPFDSLFKYLHPLRGPLPNKSLLDYIRNAFGHAPKLSMASLHVRDYCVKLVLPCRILRSSICSTATIRNPIEHKQDIFRQYIAKHYMPFSSSLSGFRFKAFCLGLFAPVVQSEFMEG